MASSASSPNVHRRRPRSLDDIRQLDSSNTNSISNHTAAHEQNLRQQAIHLANQLVHLQIRENIHGRRTPSPVFTMPPSSPTQIVPNLEYETLNEDELTEGLKTLVDIFMKTGHVHSHQCNRIIQWTVNDDANTTNYSVVTVIKELPPRT